MCIYMRCMHTHSHKHAHLECMRVCVAVFPLVWLYVCVCGGCSGGGWACELSDPLLNLSCECFKSVWCIREGGVSVLEYARG
jgi:hypothetical protein